MRGAEEHHDLMQDVDLAHGGLARRGLNTAEASPEMVKAIHRRTALLTMTESPIEGLVDGDRLVSRIGPMLSDMPDEQAGRAAFTVGSQFARAGQWNLAREVFLLMAHRYPTHARTPHAF